jgi:hypothetical protein
LIGPGPHIEESSTQMTICWPWKFTYQVSGSTETCPYVAEIGSIFFSFMVGVVGSSRCTGFFSSRYLDNFCTVAYLTACSRRLHAKLISK